MRFLLFSLLEFTLYTIADSRHALLLQEKYISTCIYCALNLGFKFHSIFFLYCRVVTRVQPEGQTGFIRPSAGIRVYRKFLNNLQRAVVQISNEYRLNGSETHCCG